VRFAVRRFLGLIAVLAALIVAVFFMVQLIPGDPVENAFGDSIPVQRLAELRHDYGFDEPLLDQFWRYLGHLKDGDLGRSFNTQQPVTDLLKQRIGTSLELAGAALALVLLLAVPLGMLAAAFTREGRHRRFELGFTGTTAVVGSIPDYLMGTTLAFLFAVQLRLLPVAGAGSFSALILPALAIALHSIATLSRIVRVETLNVLAQDYIRTARSDRIPDRIIYARFALPNVLTATLTVGGIIFANVIGGAVIVESVFARPGLGTALVNAVIAKEYPIVQGITLVVGTTVVLMNSMIDVLLGILDPRSLARHG
jgi:peptide/nickel transport system permease protein